ncbi:MAG: ATP-binding protein [Caldilineaceae bacterium]
MTALATLRPLVLFLDDLHWADPDTLAVLGRLAQRVSDAPFFLMLAYRSDELADSEALNATRPQTYPITAERSRPSAGQAQGPSICGEIDGRGTDVSTAPLDLCAV